MAYLVIKYKYEGLYSAVDELASFLRSIGYNVLIAWEWTDSSANAGKRSIAANFVT